jgi:hypothetical protein
MLGPEFSQQQHQRLALPVVTAHIDPQHRLRSILGGLLAVLVCSRDRRT